LNAEKLAKNHNKYHLKKCLSEQENVWEELRLIVDVLDNYKVPKDAWVALKEREVILHAKLGEMDIEIKRLLKERGKWQKKSKL